MRTTVAILTSCIAAGCAQFAVSDEPLEWPPFEQDVHAPYVAAGTGALAGQAFLRQRAGTVVTCAGREVLALPSTYYYRFMLDNAQRLKRSAEGPDEQALALVQRTTCDAQGNFAFSGLAAGEWIVFTEVTWSVGYRNEGGPLRGVVQVPASGQTTTVLSHGQLWRP